MRVAAQRRGALLFFGGGRALESVQAHLEVLNVPFALRASLAFTRPGSRRNPRAPLHPSGLRSSRRVASDSGRARAMTPHIQFPANR
jgi:hypothetical protein